MQVTQLHVHHQHAEQIPSQFLSNGHKMANVPDGVKILPKISIASTLQTTDRQTTDGQTTTYREREHEFMFAKMARKILI